MLRLKVYERNEKGNLLLIVADLTIGKGLFKDTYKSDVKFNRNEDSIYVTNLDGPLKHLENKWYFKEKNNLLLIIADLTIGKGPFKDTYKSDVKYNKKENSIYVSNLDGPLKYLENKWHFREDNNMTAVAFDVDFELKNHFLNIVMTKSFQFGLDKIADAFQKRAEKLFSNP